MFPAWDDLSQIRKLLPNSIRERKLVSILDGKHTFPLYAYTMGSEDPRAPVLGLVGGVHGLERIGTDVVLSYFKHLIARMEWDELLQEGLSRVRVFIVPLVNPWGMRNFSRSNANGVDLMRNAPVTSHYASFGVGGQSFSKRFPWYRGNPLQTFEGMERESQALVEFVEAQTKDSKVSVVVDVHSGFGIQDQLWHPFAKSNEPFPDLKYLVKLKELLDQTQPHHIYRFEPQSKHYMTHGDLWDYLYERHQNKNASGLFLPLTLEMGSWNWVKKNPWQLFSFLGPFNPVKPHRLKRTLRRHAPLFDFLLHALASRVLFNTESFPRNT